MSSDVDVATSGIAIPDRLTEVTDVFFGDQRVWSFNPPRDSVAGRAGRRVPWPERLAPFLKGTTVVTLRSHAGGETYFEGEVTFGDSRKQVRVTDKHGNQLAVDKSGRLQRTFARSDDSMREFLMDGIEGVLEDLRTVCGLDAFLAYGCLLGAVRNGHMIGHDSDADLSYLSEYTHPFDIARESRQAAEKMRQRGWTVIQMSGGTFKVWVGQGSGTRVGIDVFAAFFVDGTFHVVPAVRGELPRSSVLPTSTVTLEGRSIPAPASPEHWLELTYGPTWRTPDPAFKFEPAREMSRRVDGWLREARTNVRYWHDFYRGRASWQVPKKPSLFAAWVDAQLPAGQQIVDVGAGNGRDSVWLAEQGHTVLAHDRDINARRKTRRLATKRGVTVTTEQLNLNELGSVLVSGARMAHGAEVHHVYARFLLDALHDRARPNFWRWAQMVQRRGGLTFLEFRTDRSAGEPTAFAEHARQFLAPADVVAEIEERGGVVVGREEGRDLAPFQSENPHVCRLVVRWSR